MNSQESRIYIIGGGIVGISSAYFLAKSGNKVTLLEKNKIGEGCSFANAGWLTPCFAMPLPMPGMLLKSFKWLLNPNSPLYIKPSLSVDLAKWLFTFLSSMNEKQAMAAIEALVHLSKRSLDLYGEIANKNPGKMSFEQKGLLMVAKSQSGLKAIHQELELGEKFGVRGKKLSGSDCRQLEPALKDGLLGGVHFLHEAHAEPFATTALITELAKNAGAEIIEDAEFLDWQVQDTKIHSLSYAHQGKTTTAKVDQIVLTTGSWSKALGKKLSVNLPVLGGKGYSMNVPDIDLKPKIPIMYLEKKIAITPRVQGIRIAGTLELVDQDFSITERRVRNIQKGAAQILNLTPEAKTENLWTGLRPCTPDGVPMIGRLPQFSNALVAIGHQMLGFQSGLGSGELISDIANNKTPPESYRVFNPQRFFRTSFNIR